MNYYNENDAQAAAWLRELIAAKVIPAGDVDERGIEDVRPDELVGYRQCHFFAGIGGWAYALRLAGWPDDRPVWTGSCPCQPFSAAGKRGGVADERHLWPAFYWLIRQCLPRTVFGEQVASKDGRAWLAGVQADLEALGYIASGADLCAAGVGAPHIRQRLWWVAHRDGEGCSEQWSGELLDGQRPAQRDDTDGCSEVRGLAHREQSGLEGHAGHVADGHEPGRQRAQETGPVAQGGGDSAWDNAVWIECADGKSRRIEPGIEPLAHGSPGRVGLLRGYGNAIVPQVGATFVSAYMECLRRPE